MVEFIHKEFGTHMWVHESRVDEYKAAGHKLAAEPSTEPTDEKPRKKTRTTKK